MKILDLSLAPEHIQTIANWHHAQWSYLNPKQSLQDRIGSMQSFLGPPPLLPRMFVAMENNSPLGTAALVANDLSTHPELSPWLASVYVLANKRHLGIGRALVKHACAQALHANLDALYLFTPNRKQFYSKMGWKDILEDQFQNEKITIMRKQIKSSDQNISAN